MSPNDAPKLSSHNRKQLSVVGECGCYFCMAVFSPTEIVEWTDNGDTALCPCCGVDALLPGITDTQTLVRCCETWFTGIRPR